MQFSKTLSRGIAILGIVSLFFGSCNDGQFEQDRSNSIQLPEILEDVKWGNLDLPSGTIARRLPGTTNAVEFVFPEGIQYVGLDGPSQNLVKVGAGCYECTGTCADGCDVVKLGDQIGCSACTDGAACTGKDCSSIESLDQGGFIDFNQGIKLISRDAYNSTDFLKTPTLEVMYRLPEVRAALRNFQNEFWGKTTPSPENSRLVAVNFFGGKASLYVPAKLAKNGRSGESLYVVGGGGEDVSCSCKSGNSGCTLVVIKTESWPHLPIGHKCESGACTTCQMTFPDPE